MQHKEFAWLLEDDAAVQRLIATIVQQEGLSSVVCSSPHELMGVIDPHQVGVVILDIGVPPEQRLDVIANVKTGFGVPVLAMTAGDRDVAIRAAQFGADDFLAKPFDPNDLAERVQFLLGRPGSAPHEVAMFAVGDTEVDLQKRTLTVDGKVVPLSKTEWDILRVLTLHKGEPVLLSDLGRSAFDRGLSRDIGYLKHWIARLQTKLGCDPAEPRLLKPIHDIAYTLTVTHSPE